MRPEPHNVLPTGIEATSARPVTFRVMFGSGHKARTAELSLKEIKDGATSDCTLGILAFKRAGLVATAELHSSIALFERQPLPTHAELTSLAEGTVTLGRTQDIIRRLVDGSSIRLVGQSSSGKTVSAAQVACHLLLKDWSVSWLDLSDPARDADDIVLSLARCRVGRAQRHLIVIDDAQANPGETLRLGAALRMLEGITACPLTVLVLSWESGAGRASEAFPDAVALNCFGDAVVPELIRSMLPDKMAREYEKAVVQTCAGDLLLARLMIDELGKSGRVPTWKELGALAFRTATGDRPLAFEDLQLLFRLASLSQFEIDIARGYAESFGNEPLVKLLALRSVRQNGSYLAIGHRSLARMLVFYLRNERDDLVRSMPDPGAIAVDYVRNAAPQQIVATLERLDVASLASRDTDQHGTTFLAKAWESLLILTSYLAKQAKSDATWGDNSASCVFAAEAFAEIGNDSWAIIASVLRSRWIVHPDGRLPEPVDKAPSERIDFDEIQKTMQEEENNGQGYPVHQMASAIDYDRMHRTWILGLLLGFEGSARSARPDLVAALKRAAESAQDADGAFYPSRVPWVTARVLIGLAKAGESIRTSEIVRKGCEWLRRRFPEGPCRFGTWESGTGKWNTTLGTTSMCVNALARCGVPVTDTAISLGTKYLLSKRTEWTMPGRENDGAFAMETVLAVGTRWRDISGELATLLAWVRDREPWAKAVKLASDMHDESCKVAQIANSMIGIVWDTVRAELPLLLEGVGTSVYEVTETAKAGAAEIAIIAEVIQEIRAKIQSEITARETVQEKVSGAPGVISQQLDIWRQRRKALRFIETDIARFTGSESAMEQSDVEQLVAEVDKLGKDCIGPAWQPITSRVQEYHGA
jgi:hypothetical protein